MSPVDRAVRIAQQLASYAVYDLTDALHDWTDGMDDETWSFIDEHQDEVRTALRAIADRLAPGDGS